MRLQKIFNYILIGLVLAGTCPPRPFLASRSSNTCPICQTVCCCPDVCAAKIKAKAACGNRLATCKLTRKEEPTTLNFNESSARPTQDSRNILDSIRGLSLTHEKVLTRELVFSLSPAEEIHTPPPRPVV